MKKFKNYLAKIFIVFGFLILLVTAYVIQTYQESSSLMEQGNQLLAEGKTIDGLNFFTKAHNIFPWRQDAISSLKGAQLVLQSSSDYGNISEIDAEIENAEVQKIPTSATAQLIPLKAGEVFVPILMYHHIWINPRPSDPVWASLSVSPSQLNDQFNYLATHNYHPLTLAQLFDSLAGKFPLPQNPIVLSFDDGYKNFYTEAFPLLKKYKFVATEFVITGVTTYPAYLSWDQIKELDSSGLVEIGAHTQHHPDLTSISHSLALGEIAGSKADLESHLKHKINFFAYPYGSYNDFVIQTTKDAGYRGAVSTIFGANQSLVKGFLLPRIAADGRLSLPELARRISAPQ